MPEYKKQYINTCLEAAKLQFNLETDKVLTTDICMMIIEKNYKKKFKNLNDSDFNELVINLMKSDKYSPDKTKIEVEIQTYLANHLLL